MYSRFLVFILTAFALAACSTMSHVKPEEVSHKDYDYTQRYLSWLIEKEMNENNVTGLSIELVDDQKVVWAAGFGYSDAENKIQANPQTPYRLGSIAKVLTASAAMQMAERGQMDIDQPLVRYIPDFSIKSRFANTDPITPRNIMTHHSGLPSSYYKGMLDRHPKYFTSLVDEIKNEYVAYPPNYIFAYSNLGVTLLGIAIERTSGQKYGDYMQQNFFQPLGMRNTYYSAEPDIKGYRDGKPAEILPLRDLPSGGLVSTVEDMGDFMKMVFADGRAGDRQILKPATVDEMLRPQNANVPLDMDRRMGLGWMLDGIEVEGGGVVANHGGTLMDFHSMMATLPEHKLGVVIAANSASSQGAVEKVAAEALKLMLEAKTGIKQPVKSVQQNESASLRAQELNQFTGYFDTVVGSAKVSNDSGELVAEAGGHAFELTPREDGWMGVKFKLLGFFPISFNQLDNIRLSMSHIEGHDVLLGKTGNEATVFGEKLTKPAADQKWIRDYLGDYELVNPGNGPMPKDISLRSEDGMIVARCSFDMLPHFVLQISVNPVSEGEAIISGLGSGRGETIRMYSHLAEKHLIYSGFEMRKID